MIAVPTVAPSVTNTPSTGPNSTPLPAARIGPGTNTGGEDGGHHDVGQWRGGTRRGDGAPNILDVDDARDGDQIEQPEQEGCEQGESQDVATSASGGGTCHCRSCSSDSPAPQQVSSMHPAMGPPPAATAATSGRRASWRSPACPRNCRHASCNSQ